MVDGDWISALAHPEQIRGTLAENVRRERERAGLSQEELADACLVRRSTISRIEKGAQEPRISTLVAFSMVLRVPFDALTEGLPEPPESRSRVLAAPCHQEIAPSRII